MSDVDDAIDVLCWPFYDGGVTERHVREHLKKFGVTPDREALADILHILKIWDDAGFDLIGLELRDRQLQPVHYEIKALSDNLSEAKRASQRNSTRCIRSSAMMRRTSRLWLVTGSSWI